MSTPRQPEHPIASQFLTRWSPRAFSGAAVSEAQLLALLEAARWAPSASNIQPWRFVYGLAGTPGFDAIVAGLVPFNQGWAGQAAALLVVLSKPASVPPGQTDAKANPWHAFDAGAAWMSLALQAQHDGLVTHAMGGFDAPTLRAGLGIPAEVAVHAVVAVGHHGDKATLPDALQAREAPSPRLPLAQLASAGRYTLD